MAVEPDRLSPARLVLRQWTAPGDGTRLVELLAEDTETQARVRVDLSVEQVKALRDHLDRLLPTAGQHGAPSRTHG